MYHSKTIAKFTNITFQLGVIVYLPPRRHEAMPGDIFDCHNLKTGATSI